MKKTLITFPLDKICFFVSEINPNQIAIRAKNTDVFYYLVYKCASVVGGEGGELYLELDLSKQIKVSDPQSEIDRLITYQEFKTIFNIT